LVGRGKKRSDLETPIILINGTTGTGKTTLALQIAFSAARDRERKWFPCFYALEQTALSLSHLASNFGYFEPVGEESDPITFCDLVDVVRASTPFDENANQIHLCHLSPRPISEVEKQDVFERRFAELSHMVRAVSEKVNDEAFVVFFIDSINAFASDSLSRNEIYRVFSLLRNNHIPAIVTMERRQDHYGGDEYSSLECAKFLSDIVISLEKDSTKDYLLYFLEIEKSRVSLQVLGRHLYKLRTHTSASSVEMDPRTGLVLYPSIHSILSRATLKMMEKEQEQEANEYVVCGSEKDDLYNIMLTKNIKAGEFLAIVGPHGTHKLALGMNLAMGRSEANRQPRLLIVNFGGSGDFRFEGVAWTKSRKRFRGLKKQQGPGDRILSKFWRTYYGLSEKAHKPEDSLAVIVTFKIGQVTPEECFYIIDDVIEQSVKDKVPFSSVLISDAAELSSGFPLLASDPLFIPALIDLFATRDLISVCIGVDSKQPEANVDINFSLLSRADYRIVLSHYPEKHELYNGIVQKRIAELRGEQENEGQKGLKEQLVCLVIDNVSGKHYGREPRWLWVTTEKQKPERKTLHCGMEVPREALIKI
jgi:KaiC/GvpD/RAD55 family RecA-like ATPase